MIRAIVSPRSLQNAMCVVIVIIIVGFFLSSGPSRPTYNYTMYRVADEFEILDIMDDVQPPAGSIFFIETTNLLGKEEIINAQINYRKACAVESTSKLNPNTPIYILYTTPIRHPEPSLLDTEEYAAMKVIYQLNNVKIRSMNVSRFVHDSPIEPLFTSGKFGTSNFPHVHLSDILRLVVLWRYGGTYLDMDMVITKNLDDLGKNYFVLESKVYDDKLNGAEINLDNEGIGREIQEAAMRELVETFNGKGWANNGPMLLSKVIPKVCGVASISSIKTADDCRGLRILPYWIYNPYDWRELLQPFDPNHTEAGLELMKRSYAIHVYGHVTFKNIIHRNQSFVVYAELAKQYCPSSYYNSGDVF